MQPAACAALAVAAEADLVVCGHAHGFRDERVEGGSRWIVLDAFGGPRSVLRVGARGEVELGPVRT